MYVLANIQLALVAALELYHDHFIQGSAQPSFKSSLCNGPFAGTEVVEMRTADVHLPTPFCSAKLDKDSLEDPTILLNVFGEFLHIVALRNQIG